MPILGNLENKIISSSVTAQTKPLEAKPKEVKQVVKEPEKLLQTIKLYGLELLRLQVWQLQG